MSNDSRDIARLRATHFIGNTFHYNGKLFSTLYDAFKSYTRKIDDVRTRQEKLLKVLRQFGESKHVGSSVKNSLLQFTRYMSLLTHFSKLRINTINNNVLVKLKCYDQICSDAKKDIKRTRNAIQDEVESRRNLEKVQHETPDNKYRIRGAENRHSNDLEKMTQLLSQLEQLAINFTVQKTTSLKHSLREFVWGEMFYHAKALETLTETYTIISNIDTAVETEEFLNKLKMPKLHKNTSKKSMQTNKSKIEKEEGHSTDRTKPTTIPVEKILKEQNSLSDRIKENNLEIPKVEGTSGDPTKPKSSMYEDDLIMIKSESSDTSVDEKILNVPKPRGGAPIMWTRPSTSMHEHLLKSNGEKDASLYWTKRVTCINGHWTMPKPKMEVLRNWRKPTTSMHEHLFMRNSEKDASIPVNNFKTYDMVKKNMEDTPNKKTLNTTKKKIKEKQPKEDRSRKKTVPSATLEKKLRKEKSTPDSLNEKNEILQPEGGTPSNKTGTGDSTQVESSRKSTPSKSQTSPDPKLNVFQTPLRNIRNIISGQKQPTRTNSSETLHQIPLPKKSVYYPPEFEY